MTTQSKSHTLLASSEIKGARPLALHTEYTVSITEPTYRVTYGRFVDMSFTSPHAAFIEYERLAHKQLKESWDSGSFMVNV